MLLAIKTEQEGRAMAELTAEQSTEAQERTPGPAIPHYAQIGNSLKWTGQLALLVGCGVPFGVGIAIGRDTSWLLGYFGLSAWLVLLFMHTTIPWLCRIFAERMWLYLLLSSITSMALLAMSGDPYIQPLILCVPLVTAALAYSWRQVILCTGLLLLVIPAGLGLAGESIEAMLIASMAYLSLMVLLVMFSRLAIEQAAAREEMAHQRDELARLYQQANLTATLAERNRLARELHDTIAQELTAVLMQIEAAQRSFDRDPNRTRARLLRAHELAKGALDNVRRSVWTLAEPLISSDTLMVTLAEATSRFAERTGIAAHYTHHGPQPDLDPAVASQIIRVVQEALTNIEKHAQAQSAQVASTATEDRFWVEVRDDGRGFDPTAPPAVPQHASNSNSGFGLVSLRERARLAGGTLQISSAPGQGTTLRMEVLLQEE
jgi:signal transduction histidine kinase